MKIFAGAACAALLGAMALASPAGAADPVSFSCTANAVTASVAGASRLNPITAGGDKTACVSDIAGLPNTGEATTLEELISSAKTAYAVVDQGGKPPVKSTPKASAGVEDLQLTIGGPILGVGAARSSIEGSCAAGKPVFKTQSEVANISLGGFPLVLDGVVQPITDQLTKALHALVRVDLNTVVDTPDGGKAVRAAHITLLELDGSNAPLADVVIAESKLALNGAACDPNQPPNNGGGDDDNPPPVCPNGAVYDVAHKVCVIPVPGSQTSDNPVGDITGPGSVVIGRPPQTPSGGTVITLADARKRFKKSPCVRGKGLRYVVIGTNKRDKITGTNKRDRILGFGGNDRLDGGKGADCVEGGNGKDGMTGGQQNDRVFGGNGRDFLNGDAGNDLLVGGKGNDYINSAYGHDVVNGGKGRDKMNVATAGKRAIVIGGKGFDKVRANPGDLKGIRKDVERVIVTKKVRG